MATFNISRSAGRPRVSVVICTKDRPDSVRETVSGFRYQVGASPFEILVVDDGSEPALTLDVPDGGPVVRSIRILHQGRAAARNHGAGLALGSVVIFVDDDIRVGPGFVAAHETAHRTWDHAMAVGPQVLSDPSRGTPLGRFRRRLEGSGLPRAGGVVDLQNFGTAANMSIPCRVFAELGGFNPRLHCGEDQDLALRHSGRGGPIVHVPEALAVHDDATLDIRSYSRKAEWTGRHLVDFCRAQPEWPENQERLRINGPPLPGREPARTTVKKLGKSLMGRSVALEALFGMTTFLERTIGDGPLLDALYRILVGIHLQKGFRRGLAATSRGEVSAGDAR